MDLLKTRIDAYASSLDGFDVLLERGIKFLRSRAERYEKVSFLHLTTFGKFPELYFLLKVLVLKAMESNRQYTLHSRSSGDSFSRNGNMEGTNSSKGLLNR